MIGFVIVIGMIIFLLYLFSGNMRLGEAMEIITVIAWGVIVTIIIGGLIMLPIWLLRHW